MGDAGTVIETMTFRLTAGADEAAFLAADYRVQTEFIPNLPGFVRRTTARGSEGDWLVVTLWRTEADADGAAALEDGHDAVNAFVSFVDANSIARARFTELEG